MPKGQTAVQEGFHLAGNTEKIDRRSQDDSLGSQKFLGDPAVIIIDPALSLFHAESAARAELDVEVRQMDDFQFKPFLDKGWSEHLDHRGSVPNPRMR
jgi:hypothetical protein